MLSHLKRLLRGYQQRFDLLNTGLHREVSDLKLLVGKGLANQVKEHGIYENIHDAEFKVFSQFGDDGIIQYLVNSALPMQPSFIEFGVQDYTESNTRFLLMNNNWRGLIIDNDSKCIKKVQAADLYWRFDLSAVCAFVTRENINDLFRKNGFGGEIGFLSIDIDGNDYWIWESIDAVSPVVVTVEYNSVLGPEHPISVPYLPDFARHKAHSSYLYWGCSLKALCLLAEKKGYDFVGSNSNGNNAYFVRKDRTGSIPRVTCAEGYVESRFRESRDLKGNLSYLSGARRLQEIKEMSFYHIELNSLVRLGDLLEI